MTRRDCHKPLNPLEIRVYPGAFGHRTAPQCGQAPVLTHTQIIAAVVGRGSREIPYRGAPIEVTMGETPR